MERYCGKKNLPCAISQQSVAYGWKYASHQGEERRSHITGESVHNQRIERLWRDVFLHVLHYFYNEFYSLEDAATLDPQNDIHKLSLHLTYLPEIQNLGMLTNMEADSTPINNVFGDDPYREQNVEALLHNMASITFLLV
ncbi:hypothetical protein DPEC_G00367620 [Dallia pectoralis]|nr:hypothetical protein DPEC_G00367620 [Dallia pectoralis]